MESQRTQRTFQPKSFLFHIIPVIFSLFLMTLPTACERQQLVKIGFSGCISGQLADLGIAGRNAVMLAVEEINANDGIDGRLVELIIKDDTNASETAIQVDKQLINEGVVAIIGHMTSSMSISAAPVMNQNKIVMISPTSTTNLLVGKDDYFLRITSPDAIQSDIMADHAYHTLNLKRIACVYDLSNEAFTRGWLNNFKASFQKTGGDVVYTTTFNAGESFSYLETAMHLLDADPDGVLIISGALHTAMFCQQIRKMDAEIPVISSGWAGTQELIQHGGSSVEGILFPQVFNQNSTRPRYLAFKKKYMAHYGKEPNFASVCSYEAAHFLFSALKGWERKTSLKTRLINQSTFNGLQGEIKLDGYGDALRSQFIVTVKDGRFSIVGKIH